jgi:hypothetical protein
MLAHVRYKVHAGDFIPVKLLVHRLRHAK